MATAEYITSGYFYPDEHETIFDTGETKENDVFHLDDMNMTLIVPDGMAVEITKGKDGHTRVTVFRKTGGGGGDGGTFR